MKWVGLLLASLSACAAAPPHRLLSKDKTDVVESVIRHLEVEYVEKIEGQAAAAELRLDLLHGRYDDIPDGKAFASVLSDRLQALTGDGHLNVEFSAKRLADNDEANASFSAEQMERWYGAHLNFGVQRVERLEGNVGLLDLRVFSPLEMAGGTIAAAMSVVAHMDALIIDLRKNGGGMGDTADFLASFLFDGKRMPLTGVYDRRTDAVTQRYTQPYVSGLRFGGTKPVYILISSKTFSAAEAFAYNLQALKRAIVVGEKSGGGAHPFEYVRIHPHFILWSVTAKSVNPITKSNWQSVGVKPDVGVPAAEALTAALSDLKRHQQNRRLDP